MVETTAIEQARAQLRALVEASRSGALVQARLAAQLEAIDALLAGVDQPPPEAAATPAQTDSETLRAENARYVSTAIHELRTPMTSIRGFSDMLANPTMGALNDMQAQFVDTIRTNARRMEGLLTDISDMAKIRGGTLRLNHKLDTFKNIALMVEKQVKPGAEAAGKRVIFTIPDGLPLLETDGEMVAKALVKLVENSLRYSGDSAEVAVEAESDGGALVVRVRDQGIGMTSDEMEQLGTAYYRSEREEVRAHKGSGLGIPIAYGIIRLLDGTISAESTPGAGTTMTVRLPGLPTS